jgi:CheY-like chemotaxis protein
MGTGPKVIRANQFVLEDDTGTTRAVLEVGKDGMPGLALLNKNGVRIWLKPEGYLSWSTRRSGHPWTGTADKETRRMLTPHMPGDTKSPEELTVLCIDDDPLVLQFYRGLLEPRGYRVLTAAEGLHGFGIAEQHRPDVILLDVMLRGLSGYDICRTFRADPALGTIPIILLTVWDGPNVAITGQQAGADLTLTKPADAEAIMTAIEQVLRERDGPPRENEEAH